MVRKIKNTKTADQRRIEAETMQASIAEQVEQLRNSDAWMKYLEFAQAFHRYSMGNLLLILAQCPGATRIAGYRTWQNLGRQVRKGETGIRIFGGRSVRWTEEDEKTGDETERSTVRFFPVSVFDIGQSDLTDPEAEDHSTVAHKLTGEDPQGITNAATDYLTGKGWTVSREPISGSANGYTTTDGSKQVVIDQALSPAQAAKTALHEAAHVILHSDQDAAEYIEHRGIKETEAESVAYIVAGILELDTSAYSIGYVAGWSQGETEVIKETAARVLKAAHQLAEAITEPAEEKQAA
ncbi:hypothetical protein CIK76_18795 [Glutamicibacter sp. BW80]|uniref:ArdC-like ssDNA-binding domain-containing protein n=1 Tax=Glutamicibacter sp. BW80 TaxID=2024404 RepID=UPI000BB9AEA3|nr:ArdC-like ssDNA-binding domain-containing protein [Glutamicibacter sp. BW80]PCC27043.1 hypothetical protein CIK76_18795 [Glutamicibacter sp. BW80]